MLRRTARKGKKDENKYFLHDLKITFLVESASRRGLASIFHDLWGLFCAADRGRDHLC